MAYRCGFMRPIAIPLSPLPHILRINRDASTHMKFHGDRNGERLYELHKILTDVDSKMLMKHTDISECFQIELHRFRLHDMLVCRIDDLDIRKIGLPRQRTKTGELGAVQCDIYLSGSMVRKHLKGTRRYRFFAEFGQCMQIVFFGGHGATGTASVYHFRVSHPIHITAGYAFHPMMEDALPELQKKLLAFGNARDMRGLTLIATEGINGTVSGSPEAIAEWKSMLQECIGPMVFKDSTANTPVFKRWSVKIKPEIVAIKIDAVKPQGHHKHLTPKEWQKVLENEDATIIDARNHFEVNVGKFRGAIDPKITSFSEFPDFVRTSGIPKDRKILMYCTGGIRCEKALIAMEQEGYKNVFQLEGGILGYLQQFPEAAFEGECFVFDKRVAVDQHLQPSKTYGMCPHCSDPCTLRINCARCNKQAMICGQCNTNAYRRTCSKNCAEIHRRHSLKKSACDRKIAGVR